MKRFLSIAIGSYLLAGCSVFERTPEETNEPPFPPSSVSEDTGTAPAAENVMENEIARLNTKIEALETKLAALSDNVSTQKAAADQPRLRAESPLSEDAPIDAASQDVDPESLPTKLPHNAKSALATEVAGADMSNSMQGSGNVEKDFQAAMKTLNAGNYKEAANRFFAISKNYPQHPLASHALYWAGESAARARNWKIAITHWSNLETNHPRSIYVAEALAGLANAHANAANAEQAKHYRDILIRAFPDSPAATSLSASLSDSHGDE